MQRRVHYLFCFISFISFFSLRFAARKLGDGEEAAHQGSIVLCPRLPSPPLASARLPSLRSPLRMPSRMSYAHALPWPRGAVSAIRSLGPVCELATTRGVHQMGDDVGVARYLRWEELRGCSETRAVCFNSSAIHPHSDIRSARRFSSPFAPAPLAAPAAQSAAVLLLCCHIRGAIAPATHTDTGVNRSTFAVRMFVVAAIRGRMLH